MPLKRSPKFDDLSASYARASTAFENASIFAGSRAVAITVKPLVRRASTQFLPALPPAAVTRTVHIFFPFFEFAQSAFGRYLEAFDQRFRKSLPTACRD
jgi:hypothetical protein